MTDCRCFGISSLPWDKSFSEYIYITNFHDIKGESISYHQAVIV